MRNILSKPCYPRRSTGLALLHPACHPAFSCDSPLFTNPEYTLTPQLLGTKQRVGHEKQNSAPQPHVKQEDCPNTAAVAYCSNKYQQKQIGTPKHLHVVNRTKGPSTPPPPPTASRWFYKVSKIVQTPSAVPKACPLPI